MNSRNSQSNITVGTLDANDIAESIRTGELHAHIKEEVKVGVNTAFREPPTPELRALRGVLGEISALQDQVSAYMLDERPVPEHIREQLAAAFEEYYIQADAINTPIAARNGDRQYAKSINRKLDEDGLYGTHATAA